MIINSIVFGGITVIILILSDFFNKKAGAKIFPVYYKRILVIDKKLNELKNLIRLTLIHKDTKTYEKLQKEYAEFYNRVFFIKAIVYSIFFVPILIFSLCVAIFFKGQEMVLPPLNFIIFLIGIYFLIKFIYMVIVSISIRKK